MMNAGYDGGRIGGADNTAADTEGNGDQSLCAGQNIVFDGGENRSDHGQRQIAGYQYRHQRGDEQVDDLRHNFVQFLFQG